MAGAADRYEKLGLRNSLSRIYEYPIACNELSFILKIAYSKLPKNLQALIFQDTLTAFRFLPEMQTRSAVSAANVLLQSAEAALPKQKKVLALKEFKHAMVSQRRRCKAQKEEGGLAQLPQDVLEHIFSFLDLRSLISAALVSRAWNATASDNHLWKLQYFSFFNNSDDYLKIKGLRSCGLVDNKEDTVLQDAIKTKHSMDWKDAFKRAYKGIWSKKFTSYYRGYCRHCDSMVWLANMKCSNGNCKNHQIKPVSTQQVVEYILDDSWALMSSSDSDSDSDEGYISKLWAHPRCISRHSH